MGKRVDCDGCNQVDMASSAKVDCEHLWAFITDEDGNLTGEMVCSLCWATPSSVTAPTED